MPTELHFERLASLVVAVALVVVLVIGARVPIPEGWDKLAHFAVFSLLTFCLWHATGGQMPVVVVAGVIVLGGLDEWRQAYLPDRTSDAQDFLADLCAALSTGALLFMQRKPACAESSQQ
jgi:VanZ family protein